MIITPKHKPRKTLDLPQVRVYDDFLPPELFERLYSYACEIDYKHINTADNVARVWRLRDGFPLRSAQSVIYYANLQDRLEASWAYPVKNDFDLFIEYMNGFLPEVADFIGRPNVDWKTFSTTAWIYQAGTGLSLHDDGANIYSGAYAFFLTPKWDIHWGGLLLALDTQSSEALHEHQKTVDSYKFYRRKWIKHEEEMQFFWDPGFATCILPRPNRMVFIHNKCHHLVTKIHADAGENVRMSLAGFFDKRLPKHLKPVQPLIT